MLFAKYDNFEVSVLRLPESAERWNLVFDFLKLRREVFINKMKWQLIDDKGIEFEQYDVVNIATYMIAHRGEEVIAGARLLRCDSVIGAPPNDYSYMIRDAYYGRISLPRNIASAPPPTDDKSWELTRLVSSDRDPKVARAVLDCANDFIRQNGGRQCLFLGPPAFLRMAKSYGYTPVKMGDICGDESGRFLAFSCAIIDRSEYEVVGPNPTPKRPRILAEAEFTQDMAETLSEYFASYSSDGVVTLEVTDKGIWLRNPVGGRQFLGSARAFKSMNPREAN